jgi:hypothetical protein
VAALEGRRVTVLYLDGEPIYAFQTPRDLVLFGGGRVYKLQLDIAEPVESCCHRIVSRIKQCLKKIL